MSGANMCQLCLQGARRLSLTSSKLKLASQQIGPQVGGKRGPVNFSSTSLLSRQLCQESLCYFKDGLHLPSLTLIGTLHLHCTPHSS
eukprot:1911797-Amphidinium_carterae.2